MSEILDFYLQQAQAKRSSLPWLAKMQSQACSELSHRGFPTRHDEEWKYTVVDALLKQTFSQPQPDFSTDSLPSENGLP